MLVKLNINKYEQYKLRHNYDTALPFELDYRLPKPDDERTRSYSPNYVKRLNGQG